MLGILNTVQSKGSAFFQFIKEGLVMANRFLTPPSLSHPAQGSAEFDGASDYIQLDTPFSYTNHTIAAWVYNTDDTNPTFVFDARDNNDDGFRIMPYNGLFYYSVNASDLTFTNVKDQWVYVVGTYDGSTMKLYKDGSVVGSLSTSQTIDTTTNARIGKNSYVDLYPWFGNLANVAIWNRALSSDEINSVMWKGYQSLTSKEKTGLQAWYSLDDVASPAASLATMEALAVDKDATIENKAAITAAINALS